MSEKLDNLKKDTETKEVFPEHEFLGSCLRIGLTVSDLKELTYIDVMKTLYTFIDDKNVGQRKATQSDIDKLLG